jgi:aspirochlorine biosynthesis cytochrome P450 monooxygenase
VILPPKYLPDLKSAAPEHLNFFKTISDAFYLHKSVGDLYSSDRMANVIKYGLSPKLPSLTPGLLEDVKYAFETEIGDVGNGKSYTAQKLMSRIAHRAAATVMVGEELARDQAFFEDCLSFIMSIFTTALVICNLPLGRFRELLAGPLSFVHRVKLERTERALLPVVKLRIEQWDKKDVANNQLDCINWILALSTTEDDRDPLRITHELLHNLWAATSAPGSLVLEMVFQLLLEPQYLQPLLDEARSVVGAYGWTEQAFNKLILQDSYIQEINRLYPTGSSTLDDPNCFKADCCIVAVTRLIQGQPFKFSDGLSLPVGTRIAFPVGAFLHDDDIFDNPKQFDGFRFACLESKDSLSHKTPERANASKMSTTNLVFVSHEQNLNSAKILIGSDMARTLAQEGFLLFV